MLALARLTFLCVDGPHTFFQAEQALVDFGPFQLTILIIVLAVCGPLTARQVN